ncbi:DUF1285 domain-containing protein [Ferrimonas marina]|uniref:DUF1285 domain-containing protein n=1 Tax=Ferrimonas marina TaxID=299255 RepID=A0A1M5P2U2_9GAMM|nr:DUF1285 domain-containing protein [Ferrimonas marina]SHG96035.1 hypothetical protein SAMN02745129_1267 [Ferrimonas marina]
MTLDLNRFAGQLEQADCVAAAKVGPHPKLDEWDPPLCGDIDIQIDRDGQWHSLGQPIHRERLVRLFASVLRRESDGHYYLVTPVEKWRIQVLDHPFVLTDLVEQDGAWQLTGPLGLTVCLGDEHPWSLQQGLPSIALWHGNAARLGRNLYHRLAPQCEQREDQYGLNLGQRWCPMGEA